MLRLTLLAPDIVEAILDGRQPKGMTLPGLMEPFSLEWERQHEATSHGSVSSHTTEPTPKPDRRRSRIKPIGEFLTS